MKIALLNLPLDCNYGGNLQRYALMKVLRDMGHDVTHISLRIRRHLPWYKWLYSYPKRFIKRYLLGRKDVYMFQERKDMQEIDRSLVLTLQFYERYINHTEPCYTMKDIVRLTRNKYDVYMVGSDQVWRKGSTLQIGLSNYMLGFSLGEDVKRIAYAVSFGVSGNLLSKKEIKGLKKLYEHFDKVSVREESALGLLDGYGWESPKAELCLDPTLLLEQADYEQLINESDAQSVTNGKIFCYVLDPTEKTSFVISYYKNKLQKETVTNGLKDTPTVSIQQWLNNIRLADFVITDSYHGVVFSIIFRRPFIFLGNKGRGNARVESLLKLLYNCNGSNEINPQCMNSDALSKMKEKSCVFLLKQ